MTHSAFQETGEQTTRPVMRKSGHDIGVITRCIDTEMVSVHFDTPVPDINRPDISHSDYSVYFRDVIGVAE